MRVSVFGGSFNPPHVGHAMVAAWAIWTDLCDEVWLVPAFKHAFDKSLQPFAQRVRLCEAMAADVHPSVRVDAIEAELPTPSFTLHTLDALAVRHPDAELRLLAGADVLEQREHWHRWDLIEKRYRPIIVGRGGFPSVPGVPVFPEISSTEIRKALANGLAVHPLLTRSVARILAGADLPDAIPRP
jgi:nicotinate-nucleotide adenylyltransferase